MRVLGATTALKEICLRKYGFRDVCRVLAMVLSLALPVLLSAKIFDKTAKKQLTAYLEEICQWILAREEAARDGQIQSVANTPLSCQGNLARVLLAGGELIKNGGPPASPRSPPRRRAERPSRAP